jgi:ERCC4-type nuclease
MPNPVHKDVVHGNSAFSVAIAAVQTNLGVAVNRTVDIQHTAQTIINMQKTLNGLGKFPSNQINKTIDDQHLSAKLIAVEAAANT